MCKWFHWKSLEWKLYIWSRCCTVGNWTCFSFLKTFPLSDCRGISHKALSSSLFSSCRFTWMVVLLPWYCMTHNNPHYYCKYYLSKLILLLSIIITDSKKNITLFIIIKIIICYYCWGFCACPCSALTNMNWVMTDLSFLGELIFKERPPSCSRTHFMVAQQPCPATLSLTVWYFLICVLFWYQVCAHSTGERKGTGGQEGDSPKQGSVKGLLIFR